MRYIAIQKVAGLLIGAIVLTVLPATAFSARSRGTQAQTAPQPATHAAKPKPKPLHITWIKDQPAREWEVDVTKEIPAVTHTVHIAQSGGAMSLSGMANGLQGSDYTVTDKPGKTEHSRKHITAKLIATNVVAVYLETDNGKFWQKRDGLRQADADYVKSVEHPSKAATAAAAKPATAPEYRDWTISGEKTEAAFKGMIGDQVTLVKKDSGKIKVSLTELSDEDRQWIGGRSAAK